MSIASSLDDCSDFVLGYVPCDNFETAKKIATELLSKHLVACANIIPAMHTFYWWDKKIQELPETLLILKTHKNCWDEMTDVITKLHPYDCPAIIALEMSNSNPAFLQWMWQELRYKIA